LKGITQGRTKIVGVLAAIAVTATGLLGFTASGAGAAAPSGSTIQVGGMETVTGAPGATGKVTTATDVLAAWAKWENANGGLAGHKVAVTVLDDKADPAQASSNLKQLIEQDHAVAIVGNDASTTEPTWKAYIESQKTPVIGGTQYSANWFTSPMFYPVSTTVVTNVWAQVFAAKNAGKTKLASLLCSNSSVCQGASSIIAAASKDLGVDIVYNQLADANATSYTPQCIAMKNSGATVISPQGVNNVTLIRDCTRQNYKPLIITTNYVYSLDQIKATPQFQGLVGPSPSISPYNQYPATKDFFAAMKKYAPDYAPGGKKYQSSATMLAAIDSWEAGLAFAKAIENDAPAASATVTAADVIKGLSQFKDETLGNSNPPLTYSDGTAPNPQVKCFYLYKIKGTKYVDNLQGSVPKLYCQP
jgi:branched-chain amino acid transport system substrate-binding protein